MEHNFSTKKKILNQCLRWHTLRGYRFVAEVTFKRRALVAKAMSCHKKQQLTHLQVDIEYAQGYDVNDDGHVVDSNHDNFYIRSWFDQACQLPLF